MPPNFTPRTTVSAATAKQDLIRIRLSGWVLEHTGWDDRALFLAGLNPRVDTLQCPTGSIIVPNPIFSQSLSHWIGWRGVVPIRAQNDGRRRMPGRPLFGGELKITSPTRNLHSVFSRQSAISFDLDLNPTRFVRHQTNIRNIGDPVDSWAFRPVRLLTAAANAALEPSLDGNDNVLVSQRLERMAYPDAWPIQLRRYWDALTRTLDRVLLDASDVAQTSLSCSLQINVQSVETYWEFCATDALSLVRQIARHLPSYSGEARVRAYFSEEWIGNSLSVRVGLPRGLFLKVYAKTLTRIRFEIEHPLTSSSVRMNEGHTGYGFHEVWRILSECANQAASEVNRVLRFLSDYLPAETGESAYLLLHRITATIGDPQLAETIVGILVNRDGVALRPDDPLRRVVTRLVNAGILRRTREYGQTFRVRPEYVFAIAQLRGQARMRFRDRPD